MAFTDLDDAREKIACEEKNIQVVNFFIANNGTLANGIILFKNGSLTEIIDDGIYVNNEDSTIFRTINGIVEILQEGS